MDDSSGYPKRLRSLRSRTGRGAGGKPRYEQGDDDGLVDRRRQQPSPKRVPMELRLAGISTIERTNAFFWSCLKVLLHIRKEILEVVVLEFIIRKLRIR